MHTSRQNPARDGDDVEGLFALGVFFGGGQLRAGHDVKVVVGDRAESAEEYGVVDVVLGDELPQRLEDVVAVVQVQGDDVLELRFDVLHESSSGICDSDGG